ncbi:peptidase E [Amycolatopsis orientalis]|uniref:Peptidase E n=1 Tax=Amycolatopsis orientalis TaxID=31958 RepID=A0A193C445_AMYOR|nr:peptidase E [Amycolatopsis orientalis]ANN19148.1 peptidase E [Amycolatopsis orientalis]
MTAGTPTILATSMGLNRARDPWQPGPVFDYAFELARATGTPKLCLLATAGGDQRDTLRQFEAAFADQPVELSHLTLFDKPNASDVAGFLHEQDVIWVDRGSLVNLLAVWRAHQLDKVLRECWEAGVVLAGESVGSLCWFTGGTTDSFGEVRAVSDGLGLLPYSNAVHYADRREQFHQLIADETLPAGYATDAGAGLHFEGTELIGAISDRKNAGAYWVERASDGSVSETPLEVRRLKRSYN